MQKKNFVKIIIASIIQIMFSLSLVYILLFYQGYKTNYFVTLAIFLFAMHFLSSGVLVLRLENYARILTITNMINLTIISFGCVLWIGFHDFYNLFRFIVWLIILFISFYFVYFFTRPNIKEQFKGVKKGHSNLTRHPLKEKAGRRGCSKCKP